VTEGALSLGNGEEQHAEWDGMICFANDWYADPLSKKHLMLRFARKRRILWVNSVNNRQPRMAGKDFRRAFEKLAGFRKGLVEVQEGIWVLTPLYIPFHGNSAIRELNRKLLGAQIRRAMAQLQIRRAVTYTFAPTSADVVGTLGEESIVYHCVDEFSAFSDAGTDVAQREIELLAKADVVLCSAAGLYDKKKKYNDHTYLVRHGVDYEFFRKATSRDTPVAEELRALPKPVLGFVGLLADWVDLPLLAELAKRRSEWSIVLIGRSDVDLTIFHGLRNVHLLGHRPYHRLPEFLRGFDVALLPFLNNELTVNANPLKLREYLAAGLPVIAAPIPEVARYASLLALASTAEEYEKEVDGILKRGESGPSTVRSAKMASESWDAKVIEIEEILRKAASPAAQLEMERI
jgi:glycosyltransferase involved in cell wall biosynthesis